MPVPATPILTGPRALTEDGYPIISWEPVPSGVTVVVSVRNVSTQKIEIDERGVTGSEFKPVVPLEPGAYLVWVRAMSSSNEQSAWSQPRSFTVGRRGAPAGVMGTPLVAPVPLPSPLLRMSDISTIFNLSPVVNVGRID